MMQTDYLPYRLLDYLPFRAQTTVVSKQHFASVVSTRKPHWRVVFRTAEGVYLVWETSGAKQVINRVSMGDSIAIQGRLPGDIITTAKHPSLQTYKVTYVTPSKQPPTKDLGQKAAEIHQEREDENRRLQEKEDQGRAFAERANALDVPALLSEIAEAGKEVQKAKDVQFTLNELLMAKLQTILRREQPLKKGWASCPNSPIRVCIYAQDDVRWDYCIICDEPHERK